jgi:hypothetical protein
MSTPRHRLTPDIQAAICRYILSGGYPHIAAEAVGLPREVFDRWLRRARSRHPRRKYVLFYEAVMQARAQVRLAAESKALLKDPLAWLKTGPGKDTFDSPGWTNPPRAQALDDAAGVNLLLRQETQVLLTTLLRVLEPFPEARAAVAAALEEAQEERPAQAAPPSPEGAEDSGG